MSAVITNNTSTSYDDVSKSYEETSSSSSIQSGLMVVATVAAVLSLIPPCRFVGATIMRSVAVVSSIGLCKEKWSAANSDWKQKAIMCVKVVATGLGVAAIAASSPVLLVAALATDIAVQIFEMISGSNIANFCIGNYFLYCIGC